VSWTRLVHRDGSPTVAELRIEHTSLLGWTSGLVIAMLTELEQGNANAVRQADTAGGGTTAVPDTVLATRRMTPGPAGT
jgi:hypothetical protein